MFRIRRPLSTLVGALAFLGLGGPALGQATITIVNNDGPGEGFNDTTPVAPVAGNPGTTLGQQRLNAFRAAAGEWEAVISSPVEIRVDAALDPLLPCTATSGILGQAGTNQVFRDFPGAPLPNTWYSGALANAISGTDNGPGTDDIQARFNSSVDNATCLGPTNWFYGIGVDAPATAISFFDTVKHELAHGLGVQSFVDIVTTGQLFNGRNDAYTNMLHDHSVGVGWPTMTNAERLASAVDTGDLHWVGARVNDCAANLLTAGSSGGHVQMFAPNPVQPGSSVSHFDTALNPDELMEPFITDSSDQRLTDRLLADIGWNVTSPVCGTLHNLVVSAVSPVHTITDSLGPVPHSLRISALHIPIGSRQHNFIQSSVHDLRRSLGHNFIGSQGHLAILSQPQHSFVGSRFDPFDPLGPIVNPFDPRIPGFDPRFPGFDPRVTPFGGRMGGLEGPMAPHMAPGGHLATISGAGHNQIVSFGHTPVLSFGHDPFLSFQHEPIRSTPHDPFLSRGHNPFFSFHDPFLSNGHISGLSWHHPILSGHAPAVSIHSPALSNPHQRFLSRLHSVTPSNIFDGPGFDPLLQGTAMPQADPSGRLAPEVRENGTTPEGLERVPGNRAGVAYPGIMPGDPYAPPR